MTNAFDIPMNDVLLVEVRYCIRSLYKLHTNLVSFMITQQNTYYIQFFIQYQRGWIQQLKSSEFSHIQRIAIIRGEMINVRFKPVKSSLLAWDI